MSFLSLCYFPFGRDKASWLKKICNTLLRLSGSDAYALFGSPDNMKLRASNTLFSTVPGANTVFRDVLWRRESGLRRVPKCMERPVHS
ncbi:DUF1810 family protein [Paraflavisolibacter sp. H34]|uniref:DUF1810 family protein n=1 Tax=Huijunlia imazamoxiresistens TaxID=3127457 RepID=UPI0039C9C8C3